MTYHVLAIANEWAKLPEHRLVEEQVQADRQAGRSTASHLQQKVLGGIGAP